MKFLDDVQIIVRYCLIELPYWNAFIKHYYHLGIKKIHVIVLNKKEKKSLEEFYYPKDLEIEIYISNEINPLKALKEFKINPIKNQSKYILSIDCDEFIYFLNKDLNLSELLCKKSTLNIRWLMNPITNESSSNAGFLGSETKQIAPSKQIRSINNCHSFKFDFFSKVEEFEATRYGIILIHNWTRSLIDCLLKSSFSKFPRNAKTIDQDSISSNLKKGILFERAKYLAFLDIQNRYIIGLNDKYINYFNSDKEYELIMEKYTESEIKLFFELYEEYKTKLLKAQNCLESYPPLEGNILGQMERLRSINF